MNYKDREKMYLPIFLTGVFFLLVNLYWFSYELFFNLNWHHSISDGLLASFAQSGILNSQYTLKAVVFVCLVLNFIIRQGTPVEDPWWRILTGFGVSCLLFFFPYFNDVCYLVFSVMGYFGLIFSISRIGRKIQPDFDVTNDPYETFEQCEKKIETKMSINLPIIYQYKGKIRHGWINVIQPQKAVLVIGSPGSGKSFAVYTPFIEQMMAKGFPLLVYDYKMPDLTDIVFNEYLAHKDVYIKKWGVEPKFCLLDFNRPEMTMRCNPIHPQYINDPADTAEIAELIWRNITKGQQDGQNQFFSDSAKLYIDSLILFLRIHQDGRFCTFPHLIELMGRNYKANLRMLMNHEEIRVKLVPFMDALMGKAMEQLMGQISSAQIPLMRFSSPALYWVLSGNDFPLDFNNPDHPEIICMGNDPDRQIIYATTLALYTSRIFKCINRPRNDAGKRNLPCGVLLDELPTIFIKDLDQLINTARSNLVCTVIGAQDKSQLIRDYTEKEAEVIFNTVGNIFAGRVNGRTAKDLSETFGKEFRRKRSITTGGENTTMNTSYQLEELMPQSKIETLSEGFFFGKVADEFAHRIPRKLFCGQIDIDVKKSDEKKKKRVPVNIPNHWFDDDLQRIRKEVLRSPYDTESACIDYLFDQVKEEDRVIRRDDPTAATHTDRGANLEARERYDRMSEEEKKDLPEKVIKKKQLDFVKKAVENKYYDIKTDILEIFEVENIDEYEDAGPAQGGQVPPAGNGPSAPSPQGKDGNRPSGGKVGGNPEEENVGGPEINANDAELAEDDRPF